MISNIVDRRTRRYRWKQITAIIEPTSHDNSVDDSDQTDVPGAEIIVYDERPAISVADAIAWAGSLPYATTLYLYDLGSGIR
jgi:hypothetical protein